MQVAPMVHFYIDMFDPRIGIATLELLDALGSSFHQMGRQTNNLRG